MCKAGAGGWRADNGKAGAGGGAMDNGKPAGAVASSRGRSGQVSRQAGRQAGAIAMGSSSGSRMHNASLLCLR